MKDKLYFEDFKIKQKFTSAEKVITAESIDNFAKLSGDFNPLHTNMEFASNSIYGDRVAHGLLGLSVVSGLAVGMGIAERTTIAFRGIEWKFNGPIFIDDKIKTEFTVSRKRELPGTEGGLVIFRVKVINQNEVTVQSGKWSLIIERKDKDL